MLYHGVICRGDNEFSPYLGTKCCGGRGSVAGSGGNTSQVAWRSVAGLQKMADLRRYLPPVADLRRSSAEKCRPATNHARSCDTSSPDLRRIVPGPATNRAQTCDILGGNNNGRGIVSHGEGRVRGASRVGSAAITEVHAKEIAPHHGKTENDNGQLCSAFI